MGSRAAGSRRGRIEMPVCRGLCLATPANKRPFSARAFRVMRGVCCRSKRSRRGQPFCGGWLAPFPGNIQMVRQLHPTTWKNLLVTWPDEQHRSKPRAR
jgi:hypothetical protein